MSRRLAYFGIAIGIFDLAWAAGVAVLVSRAILDPWVGWAVPVAIAAGLSAFWNSAVFRRRARNDERATGTLPTALARLHAPPSLPAPARDPLHRSIDLLARDE